MSLFQDAIRYQRNRLQLKNNNLDQSHSLIKENILLFLKPTVSFFYILYKSPLSIWVENHST